MNGGGGEGGARTAHAVVTDHDLAQPHLYLHGLMKPAVAPAQAAVDKGDSRFYL